MRAEVNPGAHDALVVRVAGRTAAVLVDGEEREALLPNRLAGGPAVAGDRAEVREVSGTLLVGGIAPRTTRLERGDGGGRRTRVMVANADLLVVVASAADPPLRPRLVDRYLVAAASGGLDAAIAITKTDLPHDAGDLARFLAVYGSIGYPAICGSAFDPAFAERVCELVGGRTAILAGHSGVGKSTLTRALTGVERAVAAVSQKAGTGRHTTSDPRLVPLPGGGAVVDTAGVRTFHLPPMEPGRLATTFPEIAAVADDCRFRGCRHDGDAGCALPGRISPERLDSYRRLLRPPS